MGSGYQEIAPVIPKLPQELASLRANLNTFLQGQIGKGTTPYQGSFMPATPAGYSQATDMLSNLLGYGGQGSLPYGLYTPGATLSPTGAALQAEQPQRGRTSQGMSPTGITPIGGEPGYFIGSLPPAGGDIVPALGGKAMAIAGAMAVSASALADVGISVASPGVSVTTNAAPIVATSVSANVLPSTLGPIGPGATAYVSVTTGANAAVNANTTTSTTTGVAMSPSIGISVIATPNAAIATTPDTSANVATSAAPAMGAAASVGATPGIQALADAGLGPVTGPVTGPIIAPVPGPVTSGPASGAASQGQMPLPEIFNPVEKTLWQMMSTGLPSNLDPRYQATLAQTQQQLQEELARQMETKNVTGGRYSSGAQNAVATATGRAMTDWGAARSAEQLAATEAARARQLQGTQQGAAFGQQLSDIPLQRAQTAAGMALAPWQMQQSAAQNQYQAWLASQAQSNPALAMAYGYGMGYPFGAQSPTLAENPWLGLLSGLTSGLAAL